MCKKMKDKNGGVYFKYVLKYATPEYEHKTHDFYGNTRKIAKWKARKWLESMRKVGRAL